MSHKLISLWIIFFLLLLYYSRHCAPTPYLYGTSKEVPAENFKTPRRASLLIHAPNPKERGISHPPRTLVR